MAKDTEFECMQHGWRSDTQVCPFCMIMVLESDLKKLKRKQPEKLERLDQLKPGMVVRGINSGDGYVVTANYGDRVTAVRTQDITNVKEWMVVKK